MEHTIQAVKRRFGIIGHSTSLENALRTAIKVADTELSVLITGESGVGKEVFSKLIHELSPRKHNKFIAINTGAIPEGTINSELFGHVKGSFTGASGDRKGYFETANGGTIFLDEIGEMPLDTQSFLLRILESGEFLKVGSSHEQHTDVRVIAATNVSLQEAISKGKFREDLFYRLNTVPIKVPPLRERGDDVLILVRKFAQDFAEKYRVEPVRLTPESEKLIKRYPWPGNIRELKNFVEQLSVLSDRKTIDPEDLTEFLPDIMKRNLPMLPNQDDQSEHQFQEREILYKFLFDMKADLKDLRNLVFELISNNQLSVNNQERIKRLTTDNSGIELNYQGSSGAGSRHRFTLSDDELDESEKSNSPIILSTQEREEYQELEIVDENLSLEEMEKIMIRKALKKHNGKRKEAAEDLGISERTVFRKIKQYNITDL